MAEQGNGVFTIDGVDLRLWVTKLTRKFAVTDSENSGRVKSLMMYRDVIGTFYNYTLEIDPDKSNRTDYDMFYEIISAPVSSHQVVFPYGQKTIEFEAYSTSGEDSVTLDKDNNVNEWEGLTVEFTAMEPQRRP